METLQFKPLIVIDAQKKEENDKKLLKELGYHGFTKAEYEWFQKNGFFFKSYDLSPALREQHDRELSEWREKRDIPIRATKEPVWSSDNLSLTEKWQELLNIVIERSQFEYGRNFALFRHWLAEDEEEKEEPERRTFIREDGCIGIELRRERVKVSDAYISCQSLLNLSDEQVKEFQRRKNK